MRNRKHFLNILSFGLLTFMVLVFVLRTHFSSRPLLTFPPQEYAYDLSLEIPLDPDQTCQFPDLDPYDPSILHLLSDAHPIRCNERHQSAPLTFLDRDGRLLMNETALEQTGYRRTSLWCHYRPVIRDDGDDQHVRYGPAVPLSLDSSRMNSDFVYVSCKNFAGFTVYKELLAHPVVRRPFVAVPNRLNVFFLVLDSMSRSNFVRQLPKTYDYLVRQMDSVVLRGMTKVGDNTFPNILPILTGKQLYYYPELLSTTGRGPGYRRPERYDDHPLIWRNFSALGYATLYAEDYPEYNVFNYLEGGFERPPTDHYMRPFWLAAESSSINRLSSNLCFGARPKHELLLDYAGRFVEMYGNVSYFAFTMLTELSHDFMNQVGAGDDSFVRFLKSNHERGAWENTLFVMMGDHGHRTDPIVQTLVGSLERRMPFASIYVPEWFRRAFPTEVARLRENGRRLTSVRDLYFTLLDVLKHAGSGSGIGEHVREAGGTTLFGPISAARTCPEAGVPYQFCACEREEPIPPEHPGIEGAGASLVGSINEITEPFRNYCARLEPKTVTGATKITSNGSGNPSEFGGELKVRIAVMATPGGGHFEGMVVVSKERGNRVMEGINRINLYGHQADCVPTHVRAQNPRLREFCYCIGF